VAGKHIKGIINMQIVFVPALIVVLIDKEQELGRA